MISPNCPSYGFGAGHLSFELPFLKDDPTAKIAARQLSKKHPDVTFDLSSKMHISVLSKVALGLSRNLKFLEIS